MKAITINIPIYDGELSILYNCTPKELHDYLINNSEYMTSNEIDDINESFGDILKQTDKLNSGFMYSIGSIGVIYLSKQQDAVSLLRTLSHEISHFVFYMCAGPLKLPLSSETQEPYCYLIDYLMGESVKKLGLEVQADFI